VVFLVSAVKRENLVSLASLARKACLVLMVAPEPLESLVKRA